MRPRAIIAATVLLVACASLARQAFREPSVTLRDVRLISLGLTGGELDVHLGVHNPNGFRLDASRLNYRVFVGDTVSVAGGTLDARSSVEAGDSTVIRLPVGFTYIGLSSAARSLLMTGTVTYRVTGDVAVWTGIRTVTVSFAATGRYNAARRQEN